MHVGGEVCVSTKIEVSFPPKWQLQNIPVFYEKQACPDEGWHSSYKICDTVC